MQKREKISAQAKIAILFILISPSEMVFETERFYYLILGIVLLYHIFQYKKLIVVESGSLLLYTFLAWISCMWAPSNGIQSALVVKTITIVFLFLQHQFLYSKYDYKCITDALLFQLIIILIMCVVFGDMSRDGRLWLRYWTLTTDPNCLVGWFLIPIAIAVKKVFDKNSKLFLRIICAILTIVSVYCTLLTASRAGLVSLFVVIICCGLYAARESVKKKPIIAILIVIVFSFGLYYVYNHLPQKLLLRLAEDSTGTYGGRLTIWRILINELNRSPIHYLIGYGEGAVTHYTYFNNHGHYAHNIFIDVLFCQGLPGLYLILHYVIKSIKTIKQRDAFVLFAYIGVIIMACTLNALSQRFVLLAFFLSMMRVENIDSSCDEL